MPQRRPAPSTGDLPNLRVDSTTKTLFLDALKHVLRRKQPPLGISQINDEMRKLDRNWNIYKYGLGAAAGLLLFL